MGKVNVIPVDVIDKTKLPALSLDMIPVEGDPVEINGETYFVCEGESGNNDGTYRIGVIPLVVKNPANVRDIRDYINCLSLAHRRFRFRKGEGDCTLEECDEMIIS
jgi:hypothetical protein